METDARIHIAVEGSEYGGQGCISYQGTRTRRGRNTGNAGWVVPRPLTRTVRREVA